MNLVLADKIKTIFEGYLTHSWVVTEQLDFHTRLHEVGLIDVFTQVIS